MQYKIDKSLPPSTEESPSLGAKRIRDLKEAIIERLKNLIWGFGSDTETDEGFKKLPLKAGNAPDAEADKMIVYAKDVGGIPELFARDKNGTEIQITSNGKVNPAGILHNDIGGLTAGDPHTQYPNARFNAWHDDIVRHPVDVIKFSTGSYSEVITGSAFGTQFITNKYGHQLEVKGSATSMKFLGITTYNVTTGFVACKYQFQGGAGVGIQVTAYAQWAYHSASEQGIWGVWDKDQNELVCVLVEEVGENGGRLGKPDNPNKVLVEFKNPKKYEGKLAGDILKMNIPFEELRTI